MDLNLKETRILTWIHSNKFITPKLFHKKFMPQNTFRGACKTLEKLTARQLLQRKKPHLNADSLFTLPRRTLRELKEKGLILTAPVVRQVHLNVFEKEHDKRVIEIRIAIEGSPGLSELTWLTDYEMRTGLAFPWKKALEEGHGWRFPDPRLQKPFKRVPDGYFEAQVKGKARSFILEYEHSPYSNARISSMVERLVRDFPKAIKLIVPKDPERLVFLRDRLSLYIGDPSQRAAWVLAPYGKVISLPFLKVPWVDLDRYYLSLIEEEAIPSEARHPKVLNLELSSQGTPAEPL